MYCKYKLLTLFNACLQSLNPILLGLYNKISGASFLSCVSGWIQINFPVYYKVVLLCVADSALPCRLLPSPLSSSSAKLVCFQIPSLPFPFKSCHGIAPVQGLMLSSLTVQILLHKKQGLHSSFYSFRLKGLQR